MNSVSVYLIHLAAAVYRAMPYLVRQPVYISRPMNVLSYFLDNISIHQWGPVYRGIYSTIQIYFLQ